MKKTLLFTGLLILLGAGVSLSAQESQIELEDITTVVNTETLVAGTDSLPEFSDVVELQEGSGKIVPELPDLDVTDSVCEAAAAKNAENSIYAEGKIGGGYPLGMYGDFKVYKLNEKSPFEISFLHDSAYGYSRTDLSEGYNDSQTSVELNKSYTFEKVNVDLGLNVLNTKNGLQNKAASISDINQNSFDSNAKVDWNFAKGFDFGGTFDFDAYGRYLDVTTLNSTETVEDWTKKSWTKKSWTMGVQPSVFLKWEGYGFKAGLDAAYEFDKEIDFVHRVQTGIDFSWQNEYVKLFADADAVFGNHLNGNLVTAPFSAGINASLPVRFATRQVGLNLTGGMKSYRSSQAELEKKYKFTALDFSAQESSDWFGCFEFTIPAKAFFVFNGKIEYYHTAFGNGIVEPVYSGTVTNGVYSYQYVNRQNLVTDFTANFNYGIFGAAVQWHSNWIYVPALESPQELDLRFTVQSKDAKWNADLFSGIYIYQSGFGVPLININGQVKITDSVSAAISIEDIVNLFGGLPRAYAGQYISRSGSVTAMVKFFF